MDKEINLDDLLNDMEFEIELDIEDFVDESNDAPVAKPKSQYNVYLADGDMEAYLGKISGDFSDVTKDDVMQVIANANVKYGIDEVAIDKFLTGKVVDICFAKGLKPKPGVDGALTFLFNIDHNPGLKEDSQGKVNFKDLDLFQFVNKDQVLVKASRPVLGKDGCNVLGLPVKAYEPKPAVLPTGTNIVVDPSGLVILAGITGGIKYENGKIDIRDVFKIDGDVDYSTGDIDFKGSVLIKGNVLEHFKVSATKDIIVDGTVEGSELNAGDSIVVKEGINGMNHSKIVARGNVTAKFIQNANIISGGDVICDVAMNSEVVANNQIKLKGQKCALSGGRYVAGKSINAKTIGSKGNIKVNVTIDPGAFIKVYKDPDVSEDRTKESVLADIQVCEEQLETAIKEKDFIETSKDSRLTKDRRALLLSKMNEKQVDIENRIIELNKELEAFAITFVINSEHKIVCTGTAYPGTKINIGEASHRVEQPIDHQKFFVSNGSVILADILPSDV